MLLGCRPFAGAVPTKWKHLWLVPFAAVPTSVLGDWEFGGLQARGLGGCKDSPRFEKTMEGHNFTEDLLFVFFLLFSSHFFWLNFTKHHHDQKISLSQTCFWMFQVELPCEVCKANWPGIIRTSVCLQKTWSGMLGG